MSEDEGSELRGEFEAAPGSFLDSLMQARPDPDALARLFQLMHSACEEQASETTLPRWMADGFYSLERELERLDWLAEAKEYKEVLREHAMFLGSWFFSGVCPFIEPATLAVERAQAIDAMRAALRSVPLDESPEPSS